MAEPEEEITPHHFICLSYLNLGDTSEIDLGFAKIWNFNLLKDKYITNTPLRDHVAKILGNYKGSYPSWRDDITYHPVSGIGMISTGVPAEEKLNKIEREKVNDARLILFISFLAQRNTITRNANTGHWMGSSENPCTQLLSAVVGSEHMSEMRFCCSVLAWRN